MNNGPRAGTITLDALLGLSLVAISIALALVAFWRMGNAARDTMYLAEYTTVIAAGQEKSFGYGGEMPQEQVTVEFQGREMSNVCFTIKRDASQRLIIVGRDDSIQVGRRTFEPGVATIIDDGERFTTRGPLGRASFELSRSKIADGVRLSLLVPVSWDIGSGQSRFVIGPVYQPVASPIDEIHIRSSATEFSPSKGYRIQAASCGLNFTPDVDYSKPGDQDSYRPICLTPTRSISIGGVTLGFHPYSTPVAIPFGKRINRVHLYGVKVSIVILLASLLLSLPIQTHWPFAKSLYGAVCLMVVIGVILAARDYFFEPHASRFISYVRAIPILVGIIFSLRIPFFETPIVLTPLWHWRTIGLGCVGFGIIATMLHDDFNGSGLWPFPDHYFVSGCLIVAFTCACSAALMFVLRKLFDYWTGMAWTEDHFRAALIVGALPLLIIIGNRLLFGGSEAIHFPGFRIHLVTILVPFLAFFMSWLLWLSDSNPNQLQRRILVTSLLGIFIIAIYWLVSRDNGGMAILLVGFASAIALGLRNKAYPIVMVVVLGAASYLVARMSNSPRFELAWGTQEQQILHYDPAINLRLGRDLARAGGLLGLGDRFFVPSGLRGNLHNDLIATYVAGYLGLIVLMVMIVTYILFYTRLLGGMVLSLESVEHQSKGNANQDARRILINTSAAIVVTYGIQALWVIAASLQQAIPLTGLDLQPISASNISLVAFFGVLLSSAAITHNVCRT